MAATDFLTEARIRNSKPKGRPYKLRDGGGLFLLITPANVGLWRLRYGPRGGQSPVLQYSFSWKELSVIAGVSF